MLEWFCEIVGLCGFLEDVEAPAVLDDEVVLLLEGGEDVRLEGGCAFEEGVPELEKEGREGEEFLKGVGEMRTSWKALAMVSGGHSRRRLFSWYCGS